MEEQLADPRPLVVYDITGTEMKSPAIVEFPLKSILALLLAPPPPPPTINLQSIHIRAP